MIQIADETLKGKGLAFDAVFLAQEHYNEIGAMKSAVPLNIFADAYFELEKVGALRVFTVRDNEELVGYALFLIQPQLHHMHTKLAHNLAVYLKPSHRGGTVGYRLLRDCTKLLEKEAPVQVVWGVTVLKDYSRALMKLGYIPLETMYGKFIGE